MYYLFFTHKHLLNKLSVFVLQTFYFLIDFSALFINWFSNPLVKKIFIQTFYCLILFF